MLFRNMPRSGYSNRRRNNRATVSYRQRNARRSMFSRRRRARVYRNRNWGYRNPLTKDRSFTTLRYAQMISLDPKPEALGATGSNVWQFCGNGLYDPDITGVGHQPMYFDNYAALYNKYRVIKSYISVTVVNNNPVNTAYWNGTSAVTTQQQNYRLFIIRDGTHGATVEFPSNMNEVIEEGSSNIKWRFIGPTTAGRLPKLKFQMDPAKLCNNNRYEVNLAAACNANPSMACYYYIGITSADGVSDPPSVQLYVRLTYKVQFFDRLTIQPAN